MSAFYYQEAGIVKGPITAKELRRRLACGSLASGTLIRPYRSNGWCPASDISGLTPTPVRVNAVQTVPDIAGRSDVSQARQRQPAERVQIRAARRRESKRSAIANVLQWLCNPVNACFAAMMVLGPVVLFVGWMNYEPPKADSPRVVAPVAAPATAPNPVPPAPVQPPSNYAAEQSVDRNGTLDRVAAMVNIEEAVRKRLVALACRPPARFPRLDVEFTSMGDGTYYISASPVDCQNRFGATVQMGYGATVDAAGNVQALVMQDALGNYEISDGKNVIRDRLPYPEDFAEDFGKQ
ncbi:MAG TPA: GYF domain-containing protein [Pirellulales bacterium]|nr:GYF domain-containing protein [Pirellulales bacterium]